MQCKETEELFQDVLNCMLFIKIVISLDGREEVLDENELAVSCSLDVFNKRIPTLMR
jgi:hypothetical protein